MSRKFVYYLDGLSRSIVITDKDNDMSLDEISMKTSELMTGDRISKFKTKTDILLVRPNDIKAIHITDDYVEDIEDTIDNKNLQSFIPDIDLDDISDKEDNINVDINDTQNENQEEEEYEEDKEHGTIKEVTIPEEIIKDVDEINNSS